MKRDLARKMVFVAGPRQVGKTTLARSVPGLVSKGVSGYLNWDIAEDRSRILVTGSARLDLYRFGGDSLQGRYHMLRLHPLTVAELCISSSADFLTLLRLGGFPEPFLSGSETEARRWSRE